MDDITKDTLDTKHVPESDSCSPLLDEAIRINRYISSSGFCSRRQADNLIQQGIVTIDGEVAITGSKVSPGQIVKVNDEVILLHSDLIYIALNKPLGITCTTDPQDPSNIVDFLGRKERIFPIGRLDKNSTGLILLTNDGNIVNKILRSRGRHEKEYVVEVDRPVTKEFCNSMERGVPILDQVTLPCQITMNVHYPTQFKIILTQGLNRQIRRMCDYHYYQVRSLKRIRILNITLGNLPLGEWRHLKPKELKDLLKIIDYYDKN